MCLGQWQHMAVLAHDKGYTSNKIKEIMIHILFSSFITHSLHRWMMWMGVGKVMSIQLRSTCKPTTKGWFMKPDTLAYAR